MENYIVSLSQWIEYGFQSLKETVSQYWIHGYLLWELSLLQFCSFSFLILHWKVRLIKGISCKALNISILLKKSNVLLFLFRWPLIFYLTNINQYLLPCPCYSGRERNTNNRTKRFLLGSIQFHLPHVKQENADLDLCLIFWELKAGCS